MEESWQIEIKASPKKIFEFLTDMEKIKVWLPSHGQAYYQFPPEKRLQVGSIIRIKLKASFWKFVAKTIAITENKEIKHQFAEGNLNGTEIWIIKPQDGHSLLIHTLRGKMPRLIDQLIWRLLGRKLHSRAKKVQLKGLKELIEEETARS